MMEGFTLAKLAQAIGIRGFLCIALALVAGVAMWRADTISGERDDARQDTANERAAHAITRQSVAILQESLGRYVGAGKAAQIAQLASIEAQAKDNAKLKAQADAIRAEVAGLNSSGQCKTPKSIINAKGL